MPLQCLRQDQSLLLCTSVAKKAKFLVWVKKQEWMRVLMCVVLPFFVHSVSLKRLGLEAEGASGSRRSSRRVSGSSSFQARTEQLLAGVTPDNCFLQFPELVKWTGARRQREGKRNREAKKRHDDLLTVCIKPAASSKIQHARVAEIVRCSPANRQLFAEDVLANRRVVWWKNDGRIELRFDLNCTPAKRAVGKSWHALRDQEKVRGCGSKHTCFCCPQLPLSTRPICTFSFHADSGVTQGADQALQTRHVHAARLQWWVTSSCNCHDSVHDSASAND